MTLLETSGLRAGYGTLEVLWGVDITVADAQTVVLLGPNGAGKTTLLKCLLGLLPARGGCVRFAGHDITRLTPPRAGQARAQLHVRARRLPRPHGGGETSTSAPCSSTAPSPAGAGRRCTSCSPS